MWTISICAVMSLGLRTILPGIRGVINLNWPIVQASTFVAVGCLAMWFAVHRQPIMLTIGLALAVLATALLVAESICRAMDWTDWENYLSYAFKNQLRHALGFFAAVTFTSRVLISGCRQSLSPHGNNRWIFYLA